MPHECTTCGRTFADGSKEMLSGCPDCGGNKFQFRPEGAPSREQEPAAVEAEPGGAGESSPAGPSSAKAATTEPGSSTAGSQQGDSATTSTAGREMRFEARARSEAEATAGPEDGAQADARSGMVNRDELPDRPTRPPAEAEPEPEQEPSPGLEQLREELNEQFESIKIVEPGQYELNLMGLYDREEYIIALQENGRYVINVPDSWRD